MTNEFKLLLVKALQGAPTTEFSAVDVNAAAIKPSWPNVV